MTQYSSKAALKAANDILWPDNTSQEISPADDRQVSDNLVDSLLVKGDSNTIDGIITFSVSPILPTPSSGTHGVNKEYVDLFLQGLAPISNVLNQIDFTTAEPGSPTSGDRYINTVTGNSSGTAQAMTIDYIYEWNGTTWTETIPSVGEFLTDESSNTPYLYKSTGWEIISSSVSHNSTTSLQGGTAAEYYHLTSAEYTNLLSLASNETITGSWTFPSLAVTGHIAYNIGILSKSSAYPIVVGDKSKYLKVTAAATITLPLSSTLSSGWQITIRNNITAGGTVTIAKNAGDSTGIMLHEGATADTPLLETKYTSCIVVWDGTNFNLDGRIT